MGENTLLIGVILGQSLLIVIALGMIFYIGLKFHQLDKNKESKKGLQPLKSITGPKKTKGAESSQPDNLSVGMCDTHPNNRANGSCAICEKLLCEDCNMMSGKLHFCPEHFNFYNKNTWIEVDRVKTTPETTEKSGYLFSFKKEKWQNKNIPLVIEIHYKINLDNDQIESEVGLFCTEGYKTEIQEELRLIKQKESNV